MCKEYVRELAGAVITSVNPTSYGRMRTKLNKQGFSEIAIYSAITKHCIENNIEPRKMAKETFAYLEGCAVNMYHPKTSNDFHFLRGQFHKIRHGNLDNDEPKSPEQKGNFLCNHCHLILSEKLRSSGKNEKHLCAACKSLKSKEAYHKKKRLDREAKSNEDKPPKQVILSITNSGFKHEEASSQLSEALSSLPESAEKPQEPIEKPQEPTITESTKEPLAEQPEMPEMKDESKETITEENKLNSQVKVTEVMADESNATISLQCPTEALHLILAAIKKF